MTVVGAILAGGASRRMGTHKALLVVDGEPMALRVAAALRAGGAERVVLVGAGPTVAEALGLDAVPDPWPGAGPRAGVSSGLSAGLDEKGNGIAVVGASDQPDATAGPRGSCGT